MTAFGTQDPYSLLGFALLCALFAFAIFQRLIPGRRSSPKLHSGSTLKIQPGEFFTATVTRVIDGDTVDVSTKGRRIRIRLDAIDCPEDGQPWGDVAKYGLIKLIGGQTVSLEYHGLDHHGRTLATIYLSPHKGAKMVNVNKRMVALGHAWVMRRFYNHLPQHRRVSLNRIEAWARSKKVGLWKTENPTPPWQWRRSNRDVFH